MRQKLASISNNQSQPNNLLSTKVPKLRLKKLKEIIKELKRGNNVTNAKLKRWLTHDEFEGIKMRWDNQLEIRDSLNEKPQ